MPLILGTNSIKDTGFDVANSLRFNSGSSDYLTKSNGSGSTTKATISVWVKHTFGSSEDIFQSFNNSENAFRLRFRDTGEIELTTFISDSTILDKRTTAVFRDPSAWMHICVIINLSDGTAEDKVQLYVNGSRVTSFVVNTNTTTTSGAWVGGSSDFGFTIGRNPANSNYYNGYMSEFVFIDNNNLSADQFGEFDEDSGIWKPKDVSGLTFGTNGFYLDFENSGSLGADVSGNGNNFTVNNLTAIDQSTDTCTINFATWNPLASSSQATLSEGNLKAVGNSTDDGNVFCNMVPKSGKWYAEFKITKSNDGIPTVGIRQESSGFRLLNGTSGAVGYYQYEASIRPDGQRYTNNSTASWGDSTFITGSIIGIALDCDNGAGYISVNGTYMNSGDPTSGGSKTGAFITWTEAQAQYGGQTFASRIYTTSSGIEANFGSPSYTISSGNTDGNGYGNFEYAVPSGYYALNTKNLAEYG